MATEGSIFRINIVDVIYKFFAFVLISDFISCYNHPLFGGKRYLGTVPIRRSYFSLPIGRFRNEYQVPDYGEAYLPPSTQDNYEYHPFDKYPFVEYFGYYPSRNYYHEKTARSPDGYFQQETPEDGNIAAEIDGRAKNDDYLYGEEDDWYGDDLPRYETNADANEAFLQNLIAAQLFEDARNGHSRMYDSVADDYDDQNWFYGVPTTEVEDKEKVRQYFKSKEDEEVRELESLARRKGKNKKQKGREGLMKAKGIESLEKPTKPKSKMTDDEYFDMQKQLVVNSRKNNYVPAFDDDSRVNKKQDSAKTKFWNSDDSRILNSDSEAFKKIGRTNSNKVDKKSFESDRKSNADSSTVGRESPSRKRPEATSGQKEVVLPRPSNPVRRPLVDISNRNLRQPSAYDAIKKLLNAKNQLQKEDISQPQKRFILNEDQLTAELSGLKKKSG